MKTFAAWSMVTMLLMWVSNPQFVEHAIPGFLILSVSPMLPRACTPELGVKPFGSATLGPGAVSVT